MRYLEVVLPIVQEAGRLLLSQMGASYRIERKETYRQLSIPVERDCERLIKLRLEEHFPGYGFLAEESAFSPEGVDGPAWVLDPLDGTISYVRTLNEFAIALALIQDHVPVFALVYNPATNQLYWAQDGQGSYCGETAIHVSDTDTVKDSVVTIGHSFFRNSPDKARLSSVVDECLRIRGADASSLEMCYLAEGKIDLYVNWSQNIYDVVPGALIIQEAGGVVLQGDYTPFTRVTEARLSRVFASNRRLSEVLAKRF